MEEKEEYVSVTDKKLRGKLRHKERLFGQSARAAAQFGEWLLPSAGGFLEAEGVEQTCNFTQAAIVSSVDLVSSRKAFDLRLPDLGPYALDYTSNGRYLALAGRKGHLAILDWKAYRLVAELQLSQTTRDVKFLHNGLFLAAAQKKHTYIYDRKGTEIHCMMERSPPLKLEFLPHHFLLATADKAGGLRYQDTSTGAVVVQHRTKLGRCRAMRANPRNAVLGLGHSNGSVTMWSPNMCAPLVSMLCHRGPLAAIAFEHGGQQMVTAAADGKVKVWDLRKFAPLHAYFSRLPAQSLDISQRGLIAVGEGSCIEVWKDALVTKQRKPYMTHRLFKGSQARDLAFCPYEDVLAIGHASGISSILVPGSGEPNFDTLVANPYETVKQRREAEIHSLLDKLQPEMIVLDPKQIGSVHITPNENQKLKRKQTLEADYAVALAAGKAVASERRKKRVKPSRRQKRKQDNIISAKRPLIEEQLKSKAPPKKQKPGNDAVPRALARFVFK